MTSGQDIKTKIQPEIAEVLAGGKDPVGNKVTNVLVKQIEYVIYEIDSDDINSKMRILISGHTDETERELQKNSIKLSRDILRLKGYYLNHLIMG